MVATTFGHLKCGIGELSGHHFGSPRSIKLALQTCTEISDQTLTLPGGLRHFFFWLLLNNIINGNTLPSRVFFIFYTKKLEFFFSQKTSQIRQIFTLPPRKNIKNLKNSKKLQWVLSKKETKKKGKFCP